MVKPFDWTADTVPSMDCPAAPLPYDVEDNVSTRVERLAEPHPPSSEGFIKSTKPVSDSDLPAIR
jgi:hypothetical protein